MFLCIPGVLRGSCSQRLWSRVASSERIVLAASVMGGLSGPSAVTCGDSGHLEFSFSAVGSGSWVSKGHTSHHTRVDGKQETLPKTPSVRGAHDILLTVENCKSEGSFSPVSCPGSPEPSQAGCPRAHRQTAGPPAIRRGQESAFQCVTRTPVGTNDFKKDTHRHGKDAVQSRFRHGCIRGLCVVYPP